MTTADPADGADIIRDLRRQLVQEHEAAEWRQKCIDEAIAAIHDAPQEIAPLLPPVAPADLPRAVRALIDRARSQLVEALVRALTAETELDAARADVAALRRGARGWADRAQAAEDRYRTLVDEIWRHIGQHDCGGSYGRCLARIRDRAQALAATAPEHEHRDECERCDHLDGSICPECPLAAPSAPETAEPCPRWHTTAVDAAKAVARELGVQAVIAGELVDAVKALKAELEMAEQDRDLARQAAENRQRERDEARAALATAERERDALRTQLRRALDELGTTSIPTDEGVRWLAESLLGAREKLAAVAEIADNLEKAEVGSVMTYGDARGIAATLRAALDSTPDTGSTP